MHCKKSWRYFPELTHSNERLPAQTEEVKAMSAFDSS